jgi:hypothetical protein
VKLEEDVLPAGKKAKTTRKIQMFDYGEDCM